MNRNSQSWESFLWILQNNVFVLCSVEVVKVAQGAQIEQSALTKRAVNCQTKRSAPVLTTKHIFPNYKIYLQRAFNFCCTTALQISKYKILKSVCISYEGTKLLAPPLSKWKNFWEKRDQESAILCVLLLPSIVIL